MAYTEIRLKTRDQPLLKALQSVDLCPYQDLCILSRTGPVFAHKFILAKISSFLKAVLEDVPPHVDACITLADFDASDVKIVLDLVYCGKIAVRLQKESQVADLLRSLKIEFTAFGAAIVDLGVVFGNTLEGSNLSVTTATEGETQRLLNPIVRIERLTEEEILCFTKRDCQLFNAGPSCHKRQRGRRRDEGRLGDITNQPVNHCLDSSVNAVEKNSYLPLRRPRIFREPEEHAEQKFSVSRDPLSAVDAYENDHMIDRISTGQEGDETAFLVSETELDIKGLIQELEEQALDGKDASDSVEEEEVLSEKVSYSNEKNEASSSSSKDLATCAEARDAEVTEIGLFPVSDSFCTVKSLEKRRGRPAGKKEHACDTCGKIYLKLHLLKLHKLSHTGEKPFKCHICGKSFVHKVNLNQHHVVHNEVKAHSCSFCGKTFSFLCNLKTHINLVHMHRKDFSCSSCGKSFSSKSSRDIHFQVQHMNVISYECSVCGAKYRYPGTLRYHKKKHL